MTKTLTGRRCYFFLGCWLDGHPPSPLRASLICFLPVMWREQRLCRFNAPLSGLELGGQFYLTSLTMHIHHRRHRLWLLCSVSACKISMWCHAKSKRECVQVSMPQSSNWTGWAEVGKQSGCVVQAERVSWLHVPVTYSFRILAHEAWQPDTSECLVWCVSGFGSKLLSIF